jgi:hypothetical protein
MVGHHLASHLIAGGSTPPFPREDQPRSLLGIRLLRQLQSVLCLDTEVANRAFELRVAQEELHRAQVLRSLMIRDGFVRRMEWVP